jgi:PAS domain S-box-containing protein
MVASFAEENMNQAGASEPQSAQPAHEPALVGEGFRDIRALLDAIIQSLPFRVWACDRQGTCILQNPVSVRDFGPFVGKNAAHLPLPPESLASWQRGVAQAQAGQIVTQEVNVRWGGATRAYRYIVAPIRDGDAIRGTLGVDIDITEQKQAEQVIRDSEERFRLLADHSSDVISRHGPDGRWRYLSPACRAVLGYHPDELVGLDPFEFIHPDDRGHCLLLMQTLVETGQAPPATYRVRRSDGQYVWLESSGRAVTDPRTGAVSEIVATSRDVTERIESARQLRQREADLAHAERLSTMGQMASELAHELNQPLYAIVNFAEACLGRLPQSVAGSDQADLRRWLEQIAQQGRRAGDVIRRITQFVRKGELDREPLDLNQCIRQMSVLLEFGSRGKGIHVAYDLATPLPSVVADRLLIEQVLLNLVRNAAEAMEETDPARRRIVVRTFRSDDGGAGVAVVDSGRGLPSEHSDRLFEPYFTTKPDGTGMGLAICRSTIDAHNGRIWAENNPGGGATFQFVLPPAHRGPQQPA